MNTILNLLEPVVEDDSISRFEYHNVLPYSSTSLNNNDEIRIPLHQQDVLTLPSESRIFLQGTLEKAATATYGANDGLCNNAMAHLFSEIRYELNGIVIDRVRNPGITSLLKGIPSFNNQEIIRLSNSSFRIEDKTAKEFTYCLPLKLLLGFAEDYKKVLLNVKQELVLIRSRTNNNSLIDGTGTLKMELSLKTIQWQVPFVNVNDTYRLQMITLLQKNIPIHISFRGWETYEYPSIPSTTSSINWPIRMTSNQEKPRFVIIGFQAARSEVLKADSSVFDHCDVRNIRLFIGCESYPYTPLDAKFTQKQIATLYENFVSFRKQYYALNDFEIGQTSLTTAEFLSKYPIWVIDCSRQSEVVKGGAVDVRVEIDALKNFPENTSAYCVVINDRLIEYVPFSGIVRQLL